MPDRNQANLANQSNDPSATARKDERSASTAATPYGQGRDLRAHSIASPFSIVGRLMDEMDRMFEDFGTTSLFGSSPRPRYAERTTQQRMWAPQVDVFERDGKLVVHADLPGTRQEDVRVRLDDGVLVVSGERRHEHSHEQGGVYQCERSYGAFQRQIPLPEGVAPDSVTASFDNGVLEVTMPMPAQKTAPAGRAIPIQTKSKGVTH